MSAGHGQDLGRTRSVRARVSAFDFIGSSQIALACGPNFSISQVPG